MFDQQSKQLKTRFAIFTAPLLFLFYQSRFCRRNPRREPYSWHKYRPRRQYPGRWYHSCNHDIACRRMSVVVPLPPPSERVDRSSRTLHIVWEYVHVLHVVCNMCTSARARRSSSLRTRSCRIEGEHTCRSCRWRRWCGGTNVGSEVWISWPRWRKCPRVPAACSWQKGRARTNRDYPVCLWSHILSGRCRLLVLTSLRTLLSLSSLQIISLNYIHYYALEPYIVWTIRTYRTTFSSSRDTM